MKVVVVYESMFGGTRRVAEHIAQGIRDHRAVPPNEVSLRRAGEVTESDLAHVDLLVVGAPTHVFSLPDPTSRIEAERWSTDPRRGLTLEPGALCHGVREWLDTLSRDITLCAAFDTRADLPKPLSGAASQTIARRLARTGRANVLAPESFRIAKDGRTEDAEFDRAVTWGTSLASAVAAVRASVSAALG